MIMTGPGIYYAMSKLQYRAVIQSPTQGSGMGLSIRQASFPDKSAGTSFDLSLMGQVAR
jgi:nitrogen-specific signal transduction histidine kinase